jgi:hypothetical protein
MANHFTQDDYRKLQGRLNPRFDGLIIELQDTLEKYKVDSHIFEHLKDGWEYLVGWLQSPQRWPEVDTFDDLANNTARKVLYVNGVDYKRLSRDQLKRYSFIVIKAGYPEHFLGTHLQALKENFEVQPNGILNIQKYVTSDVGPVWDERAATVAAKRISEMIICQEQRTNKPLIRASDEPWKYRLPWNFLNLDGYVLDPVSSPASLHQCLRTLYTLCEEIKRRVSPTTGFGKPYDQPERGTFFADVESCLRFLILGEKGTFSGNHTDILAGTWILSLCGLKLWWIFTGEFDAEAKEKFVNDRASWNPGGGAMQVLPLEPGDYLMMMPGHLCAHAPFSMEDCLMTGGMFWNEDMLPELLENMAWICENNARVSNEGVPRQLIAILDVLRKRKGISKEAKTAIKQIEQRLRPTLSCKCAETGECGADCTCANPVGHPSENTAADESWYRSSGCTSWCGCDCQKMGRDHGHAKKRGRSKTIGSPTATKRSAKKVRAVKEANKNARTPRPYIRKQARITPKAKTPSKENATDPQESKAVPHKDGIVNQQEKVDDIPSVSLESDAQERTSEPSKTPTENAKQEEVANEVLLIPTKRIPQQDVPSMEIL